MSSSPSPLVAYCALRNAAAEGNTPEIEIAIYPYAMLRTPIRSYRRFLTLGSAKDLRQAVLGLYDDEVVRRALRVKSGSLFAALERHQHDGTSLDDNAFAALYRYYVRLTTRATPLMMFAGVGAVRIDASDRAVQAPERAWRFGCIPSWSSILTVTRAALFSEVVRRAIRYRLNETALVRGGVICYFTDQHPTGSAGQSAPYRLVSMRNTSELRLLLNEHARWWTWEDLVQVLQREYPEATGAEIEAYILSMLDAGVLCDSLQPSSIGPRPEQQLHTMATTQEGLEHLSAQSTTALRLTNQQHPVLDPAFDSWWQALEQHPWVSDSRGQKTSNLFAVRDGTTSHGVLRIDIQEGGISRALVAQFGELVARTPYLWTHHLDPYRQAIVRHFADGKVAGRIPFLELLFRVPKGQTGKEFEGARRRLNEFFRNQFLDADADNQEQVDLDLDALQRALAGTGPSYKPRPPGFAEALLRCLNLNGKSALLHYETRSCPGTLLNRFLHWEANDPILLQQQEIWRLQERLAAPALLAEVTCGGGGRFRDLSHRPNTYEYQIVANGPPSVDAAHQIHLDELSVYLDEQGPVLWWEKRGVNVIPRQLSAFRPYVFSAAAAMLLALDPTPSDWGIVLDTESLPMRTARLCYRDIVLRPRSWRLQPRISEALKKSPKLRHDGELRRQLADWRKRYEVPRIVRLGDANHNAVDLESPMALLELEGMLESGVDWVSEEYFSENSPVTGDDGPLVGEAVVQLGFFAKQEAQTTPKQEANQCHLETPALRQAHVFGPGAPWLFLKFYYGSGFGSEPSTRKFIDDDLLSRFVAPLIADLERRGLLSNFHFVRYADPEAHLRLRLEPRDLCASALLERIHERIEQQARSNAFDKWVVATYEREVDRYGGPDLIAEAERLFTADSRLCLQLLSAFHKDEIAETPDLQIWIPIRTLNTLFRGFGYDLPKRCESFLQLRRNIEMSQPPDDSAKRALDLKYREHSRAIQKIFLSMEADSAKAAVPFTDSDEVSAFYESYEKSVQRVAAAYQAAAQQGTLSRPITDVLQSVFHMHCNRLFGASELEFEALCFSQRALEAVSIRMKHSSTKQA